MKIIRGELDGHIYEIEIEYMRNPASELDQRFVSGCKVTVDGITPTVNQDPLFKECTSRHSERSEQAIIECVEEYIGLKFPKPN